MTEAVNHNLWIGPDVAAVTGGHGNIDWVAGGVSIDSRSLNAGDLFIALKGPNFDGHKFVASAFDHGAAAALVEQAPVNEPALPCLQVLDSYQGLLDLADAAITRSRAKRIAVTGSVGKTGTKEMLARVLENQGRTAATQGNLNNHIGLPLSLARMAKDTEFGVFELGMNAVGEIEALSEMLKPDVAIITRVELVHAEFFKNIEEIARAKGEVFSSMAANATAVLNSDDENFDLLASLARDTGIENIITFGEHNNADVGLKNTTVTTHGQRVEMSFFGETMAFDLRLQGRHWALNAMAVLAAVSAVGGDVKKAADDLKSISAMAGRGQKTVMDLNGAAVVMIDESYNASPASMTAALEVLATTEPLNRGRRIAILGDMLELGEQSKRYHRELKEAVLKSGTDYLVCVGPDMKALWDALSGEIEGQHFQNSEQASPQISKQLRDGDVVMIKGSKGSRMDIFVNQFKSLNRAQGDNN